jgi:hypothetical protein
MERVDLRGLEPLTSHWKVGLCARTDVAAAALRGI